MSEGGKHCQTRTDTRSGDDPSSGPIRVAGANSILGTADLANLHEMDNQAEQHDSRYSDSFRRVIDSLCIATKHPLLDVSILLHYPS